MSSTSRKPEQRDWLMVGFPLAEAAAKTFPFTGRCSCGETMEPVSARQWFCPSCGQWAEWLP